MGASLVPWLSDFHTVRFSGTSVFVFVFLNLFLSFFWLCEEVKCIYLCLHLGRKYLFIFNLKKKSSPKDIFFIAFRERGRGKGGGGRERERHQCERNFDFLLLT